MSPRVQIPNGDANTNEISEPTELNLNDENQTEDNEFDYSSYSLLPQDIDGQIKEEGDDDDDNEININYTNDDDDEDFNDYSGFDASNYNEMESQRNNMSNKSKEEIEEFVCIWNQPVEQASQKLRISEEDASNIKSLMSGFKLPEQNIPNWARNVSDQQWQSEIVRRIKNDSRK